MNITDIFPDINLEDYNYEFKQIIAQGKDKNGKLLEISWLKTICAFANSNGGTLFIGVNDKTHDLCPIKYDMVDKLVRMINQQIKSRIEPNITYKINSYPLPNSNDIYILSIEVKSSLCLPVILHQEGNANIYVRAFGSSELASSDDIRRLVLLSENIAYDSLFTNIKFVEQDFSLLFKEYYKRRHTSLTIKTLISIGFIDKDLNLSKGALFFKDNSDSELSTIKCVFWPGFTKGSRLMLKEKEFKGNFIKIIKSVSDFIFENTNSGTYKTDNGLKQAISYPRRSVLEGIANALGHRNYFMDGTQIEINIFKDRLEIVSPGSLLGVTAIKKEKNISKIIPRRRNAVIAATLGLLQYMDNKGSGFDLISDDYRLLDEAHKPFINSDQTSFTLTLPNMLFSSGVIDEDNEFPRLEALPSLDNEKQLQILSFCYLKGKTAGEIAKYLSLSPSTYFKNNYLFPLVQQNYLIVNNGGRYPIYLTNVEKVNIL